MSIIYDDSPLEDRIHRSLSDTFKHHAIETAQDVITGDYVTSISIKNDEASSSADLRVSVKTSTTWGIAAIAIIVVLVAVLGMIFKKFGRR